MEHPVSFSDSVIRVDRSASGELPFYSVPILKLAFLSLLTFGLYEIFWFYKNWKLVREHTEQSVSLNVVVGSSLSANPVSPFWRALWSVFFCYSFVSTVNEEAHKLGLTPKIEAAPVAILYALLVVAHRLPETYWLLSFLSFVPLIPVARQIREIHETIRPGAEFTSGWSGWSFAAVALGALFAAALVIPVGPPTQVLRQTEIPPSYQQTLVDAGVLQPDEQMDFFYSGGLFSILEDGNLLTGGRVVSYETLDEELYVASATYSEIADLQVEYFDSFWDDTIITVSMNRGDEFLLVVSAEEGRDREFVSMLRRRMEASGEP